MDSTDQTAHSPEPAGSSSPLDRPASPNVTERGGCPEFRVGEDGGISLAGPESSPRRDETKVEPLSLPGAEAEGNGKPVGIDGAPLPEQHEQPTLPDRLKTLLIGKPRDLQDQSIFKHVSLIAFFAWIGLGADGLSSSCYGPPEAFGNLHEHRFLAVFLAIAIAATIFIISACYSHIIEAFPSGGGGYLVASKLLGPRFGVVSGCALLVDYVLTITVSISAAGDALFGLMGKSWFDSEWKLYAELAAIIVLILLNLRGVKESILVLMPIFLLFLLTHAILIVGSISMHLPAAVDVGRGIAAEVRSDLAAPSIGLFGMLWLLLHAYSLGAGTYTGIEAVSNSMPVMREPRVATAQRTMRYMAFSLAFAAAGLIVAYLLLDIHFVKGTTLNQVLVDKFISATPLGGHWLGGGFVLATLLSEGALLFVAAQAGFIDGPRVLANMAHDSWMPRWFSNLSERLATHNGILLMGLLAIGALLYTHGNVYALVIMYSINVFITFSLSMIGMCRHWYAQRGLNRLWRRRTALFAVGSVLCVSILVLNIILKRKEGGWHTIAATCVCVGVAFLINRYYMRVGASLRQLDEMLTQLPTGGAMNTDEPDPSQPAAVILVGDYSGLGIHTMLNAIRFAPGHFRSFVFVSVGVIDSGNFKGSGAVEDLRAHCEQSLQKYVELSRRLGLPAASILSIGTDAVDGLEQACLETARKFPKATFFAGQLVFQKDTWLQRFLHNQTAYSLQRRLQWAGVPMVILPTRVR
jgi:amino acid transporter